MALAEFVQPINRVSESPIGEIISPQTAAALSALKGRLLEDPDIDINLTAGLLVFHRNGIIVGAEFDAISVDNEWGEDAETDDFKVRMRPDRRVLGRDYIPDFSGSSRNRRRGFGDVDRLIETGMSEDQVERVLEKWGVLEASQRAHSILEMYTLPSMGWWAVSYSGE